VNVRTVLFSERIENHDISIHRVFHSRPKTHLFSRSLPRNLPLSHGLISRFLSSTCTEISGVENIGQCGRLSQLISQLSWLLGAL